MLFWSRSWKTALQTNSCAILLGILIRDLQLGFQIGMVITLNLGIQLVLVAVGQGLGNGIASTNSCGILRPVCLLTST